MRYRLIEFRVFVTRILILVAVYAAVLGIPVLVGFHMMGPGPWLIPAVAMAGLALVGPFVFLYMNKEAEKKILREQQGYQKTLRQASAGMGRIRDLGKLLKLIAFILARAVRIDHVAVYVLKSKGEGFILAALRRIKQSDWTVPRAIADDSEIVRYLRSKSSPLIMEDLSRRAEVVALLDELRFFKAALVFPIFIRSELVSIAVMGSKAGKRLYNEDDISVFSILANQAALAIENAMFNEDMRRTKEQLLKAEKMATIGIMADGLSHQINNRLHAMGFIAGDMLDTLNMKKEMFTSPEFKALEEEFRNGFARLEDNVVRGREIVQGLMKYTRKGDESFGPCDVDEVLKSSWEMAQFKIRSERMNLIKDSIDGKGIKVRGNFTQLQEVFFNLIDNAYDAMIQRKDELHEDQYVPTLVVAAEIRAGHVVLSFRDNGIGVKDEDREKLFTAFFTTKSASRKGTGLGLYVMKKIVEENHGGRVEIRSQYREGTEFQLVLPVA